MNILLVEDDPRVARVVERALGEAGHDVELAVDGADGVERAMRGGHDVIILDVLLPVIDGFQVCKQLRQHKLRTPVLMLTARDSVSDRVTGLDAGADDYLTKPFALEELLARIRALARRGKSDDGDIVRVGDLALDPLRHEVKRGDQTIDLTAKEFELLHYLMQHPGRVLTKSQILDHVWGYDAEVSSNVVEIYVHYVRNRVDRGYPRPLIRTIRGVGYTVKA